MYIKIHVKENRLNFKKIIEKYRRKETNSNKALDCEITTRNSVRSKYSPMSVQNRKHSSKFLNLGLNFQFHLLTRFSRAPSEIDYRDFSMEHCTV